MTRSRRWFTPAELVALARTLAELERLKRELLRQLNGRVRVAWIDPLGTFGKATKFYDRLRSELDREWCQVTDDAASPFSGEAWRAIVGEVDITPPPAERWQSKGDA